MIAKMKDCGAGAALEGFTKAFARIPPMMRRSLAYDQGKEMARHKELSSRLDVPVYFCEPHSPWKGRAMKTSMGLSANICPRASTSPFTARKTSTKLHSLNTRPRAVLGFQTPEEVFMAELSKLGGALQI